MEDGGELLLHADGGAAPVDIAGQGEQVPAVEHGDGLLPHRLGRFFQVQRVRHRDVKDIVSPGCPPGHQRLEDPLRVLPQGAGHRHPVGGLAVPVGIGVGGVGNLLLVQDPHDVGFFLFYLSHYVLPLSSLSTAVQADMRRPFFIDTPAL